MGIESKSRPAGVHRAEHRPVGCANARAPRDWRGPGPIACASFECVVELNGDGDDE